VSVDAKEWRLASLPDVFRVLNDMKTDGMVEDYAIGGAMAVQLLETTDIHRATLDDLMAKHGINLPGENHD
jgi:hypothetical protein